MKIIEHVQKIESRSVDELLNEAESRKEKGLDIYYAFLAGLLKTAYEQLQFSVNNLHNNRIKEKHEEVHNY